MHRTDENRNARHTACTYTRLAFLATALCGCGNGPSPAATPSAPSPPASQSAATPPAPVQHGVEAGDINRKQDPCTDFFEYANGAWRANNPIPPSMSRWSRRWAAGEANKERLKDILDEVATRQDWAAGSVEQLIGTHYAACMDDKKRNDAGLAPIAPLLAGIEAMKSSGDVQKMIAKLHHLAIPVPFAVAATQDLHEPTRVIANILASGLGLPDRDYYLKPEPRFAEARDKYRAHVAKTFVLAGLAEPKAKAAAEAVFAVEKQLASASLDNVAKREPRNLDHKTAVAQLAKLAPHVDWKTYLNEAGIGVADLNVEEPRFVQEVDRQIAETPLPTWKTYLKWHLLASASDSLSGPFAEESFAFNSAYLGGAREIKPLWKRCAESTDHLLGEALGKKYVERYFPPEAKTRMQELVKNLLLAMKDTIDGLTWMGPETKKKALEKLATFNPKIGYPDKWKDYSSVKVTRDGFWADVVAGRAFNVNDDRATIGKPVDRGRWGITPPTSDAYYNSSLNEIVFPAGILQPPAFSMDAIDAVNYGAIGVVIGHEISHGFDDEGAQFDAEGRFENWWTDRDLGEFRKRGQCVVDQFEGYFIEPGIHHNGKLVLGESIGDLAGAKLAWLGFKKSQEGKPQGPAIDGFSPDQQFFIAWGQFRGDAVRPEAQKLFIQSDPHPIAKFRVIGPLSNLPAFQKAFACKDDAPMVRPPKTRCEVW
ncbi:MAG TPA: M13 family metallopeptidase [Polyangiaceae bacterium]|nr:M13 family metallopeptidase [Polyangiaceae bacterium]